MNFYTIDPRGLVGASSDFMQMTGAGLPEAGTQVALHESSDVAEQPPRARRRDRRICRSDSNSFGSAFERIVDSNSRYYVLGYRLPDRPADGQFHRSRSA